MVKRLWDAEHQGELRNCGAETRPALDEGVDVLIEQRSDALHVGQPVCGCDGALLGEECAQFEIDRRGIRRLLDPHPVAPFDPGSQVTILVRV